MARIGTFDPELRLIEWFDLTELPSGWFDTDLIDLGAVTISPAGIASGEAFGTPSLTRGAVIVSPTGIASGEAFGTPSLTRGAVIVSPTGIASGEAFGTTTISAGTVVVSPSGIASGEAFGTTTISAGTVVVSPSGIASAEAFGTPSLPAPAGTLNPVSIASAEAFGTPALSTGVVTVSPAGIASAETFGTASVSQITSVLPSGIPSAEAFGVATIIAGQLVIVVIGIPSEEAFGTATIIDTSGTSVSIIGIPSEEAFGLPFVRGGFVTLTLKKRISDALVLAARLGTFLEVQYDSELRTLTQGLQVAPASIETNELRDAFRVDTDYGRTYRQDYTRWSWEMILRFNQEVICEVFERRLLNTPICLLRTPDEDRQVQVLLVDTEYTHPPREGPSNGTLARYRFQAELSKH